MRNLSKRPYVELDKRDFGAQLLEAEVFFSAIPEKIHGEEEWYSDKDGLIEFIVASELIDNPEVMEKLVYLKKYLISLTSIVTSYVNKYSASKGQKYKTDIRLWELALSKLPLMGPSKLDEQKYTRHIKGLSIATDFINFIVSIVADEKSQALDSFRDYMTKQGDALRFGVEKNKDYYNTIAVGVQVEVMRVGENIIFVPKVQQYRIQFDRSNSKFASACASADFVDISFDYKYAANVFDYEALDDPEVKKDFDAFIQKSQKAQIDESYTFFEGEFPELDE